MGWLLLRIYIIDIIHMMQPYTSGPWWLRGGVPTIKMVAYTTRSLRRSVAKMSKKASGRRPRQILGMHNLVYVSPLNSVGVDETIVIGESRIEFRLRDQYHGLPPHIFIYQGNTSPT
jgi:hypothetical protein